MVQCSINHRFNFYHYDGRGGMVKLKVICPYCNREAVFMSTKEFYGKDYGTNVYSCSPCDAYVGTHGKGRTPLGILANKETREYRKRAHSLFDPLWKGKYRKMNRSKAYRLMQDLMDLPAEKAHIGMFNVDQCKELIGKIKVYRGV